MMDFASYLLHNDAEPSDEELLEQIENDIAAEEPGSYIDEMQVKIAQAYRAGVELAREQGMQVLDLAVEKLAETEKVAILPLIMAGAEALGPTVGKAIAGNVAKQGLKGIAGDVAKGVAKNVAVDKATSALSKPRQAVQGVAPAAQAASGGFNYGTGKFADAGGGFGKLLSSLGGQAKNFAGSVGSKGPGTLGQKIVGGLVRNPGAALIGAGAIGGAVMAPRDPVTGQKEYARGALMGGALGGGAYALGAGNKLRSAIVNPKGPQILGQGAGQYARDATRATGPAALRAAGGPEIRGGAEAMAAAKAAPAAADPVVSWQGANPVTPNAEQFQGAASGVQVDPRLGAAAQKLQAQHAKMRNFGVDGGGAVQTGGLFGRNKSIGSGQMVSGEMQAKFANRQTLSYDPVTKQMTRTHLTPSLASNSQVAGGGTLASPGLAMADIPAGTQAPVGGHMAEPRGPAPAGLGPSGGNSQVFSSQGGNVLSSSPAPGVAARPQVAARPMAAPPPIPAAAMRSPVGAGAAALKMAPKAPSLPSLSGARSLVSSLK